MDFERKGDYLIAVEVGQENFGAIKTVDISDPPNASMVADIYPGDPPWHTSLYGDLLAVSYRNNWELYDAGDPTNLSFHCQRTEFDDIFDIDLWGNALYVIQNTAGGHKIRIYNVTNPATPSYEGTLTLANSIYDICFTTGYMYVINGPTVETYSLANPFLPNNVDSYSHALMGYMSGCVQGNYLYLCANDTLEIADISNPASPSFVGEELFPLPSIGYYDHITVDGQFGYMAGYSAKSHSCLLWPPDNPTLIGEMYPGYPRSSRELLAYDGYFYEGTESFGLCIFDLY